MIYFAEAKCICVCVYVNAGGRFSKFSQEIVIGVLVLKLLPCDFSAFCSDDPWKYWPTLLPADLCSLSAESLLRQKFANNR